MGKQVTSKISPTQVGTGRSKQNLYTATKVSGPIGTPPTYITDIIKYDNAKGENARTIGTRTSDDPGKITWNENASGIDKQNATKIGKTSANQVKSIQDEVTENSQEKEALNKASGNNNKAAEGDDATMMKKFQKQQMIPILNLLQGLENQILDFTYFQHL